MAVSFKSYNIQEWISGNFVCGNHTNRWKLSRVPLEFRWDFALVFKRVNFSVKGDMEIKKSKLRPRAGHEGREGE
jgi:hypothetical protein